MRDRRLLVALANLAVVAVAAYAQRAPEAFTRARALRVGALGSGWAAIQLHRNANRAARLSSRLHAAYLREVI